ncbi:hypothetical protein ACFL27_17200 [candidate division CSSED10-310 bacterium]|uniref:Membrane protein 6-pyruvoyl-tetrahydropterin synthase-related domain-containing protein n=1 Tax=candidate division CSSED10-310 bacterium TaxID=2855610 RepID=A0ABV6Z0F7_UNCC1
MVHLQDEEYGAIPGWNSLPRTLVPLLIFLILSLLNFIYSLFPTSFLFLTLVSKFPERYTLLFCIWMVVIVVVGCGLTFLISRARGRPDIEIVPDTRPVFRFDGDTSLVILLYVISGAQFFFTFPLSSFPQLIFHGDFPYHYLVTLRGVAAIKAGALFGWEHNFLGGYPAFLDFSKDLGPFLLPLTYFFEAPVAYHLLILITVLLLPLLYLFWCRTLFGDRIFCLRATIFFLLLVIMNFRNLMNGMVNALVGLALFLFTTALFRRVSETQKTYLLVLVLLSLIALCHVHGSFFIFSLLYLLFDYIYFNDTEPVKNKKMFLLLFMIVGITPYFSQHLEMRGYSITTSKLVEEGFLFGLLSFLKHLINPYRWHEWGNYGIFLFFLLPSLVSPRKNGSHRFLILVGLFFFSLTALKTTKYIGFALSRNDYILLPIACVWAGFLFRNQRWTNFLPFLMSSVLLFGISFLPFPKQLPHIENNHYEDLNKLVAENKESRVLIENTARWNAAYPGFYSEKSPLPHFEPYIGLLTGRSLLSNPGTDPYHYSVFRMNTITGGTFLGKPLWASDRERIIAHLKKWSIHYIIVWSQISKQYFAADVDNFEYGGRLNDLTVFRFKQPLASAVKIFGQGIGRMRKITPFSIQVTLENVEQGNLIVVNMNYFPAWTGFSESHQILLFGYDGQLAFVCPDSGSFTVNLHYSPPVISFYITFITLMLALPFFVLPTLFTLTKSDGS